MLSMIRAWISGLAGAAIFCALATELTPVGTVRKLLKSVCGIVMAFALVSPLISFDFEAYSLNAAKYRENAERLTKDAEEISDSLSRTIIESDCEAYILDKAHSLGAAIESAKVCVEWSNEGLWHPVAVVIAGEYSEALSDSIEGELGIPKDKQSWEGE